MVEIIKEMQVKYKTSSKKKYDLKITRPEAVIEFGRDKIGNETQEIFMVLFLDSINKVVGYQKVTTGLLNSSQIHPREVFKSAILSNSASLILFHNHPSGTAKPSSKDRLVTTQLIEAGKILGIIVLDHIIVTSDFNDYFSFKEEGFMQL